ncbi:MAG: prepilin-type N-terminal cleavage/methylation domain-containing protein [Phycisphaerae bacterium]|nr:prepilin-type N-terminal cleavage/methylation domain-containing protein [Phycisphaerae bacterium]
MTKRKADGVTGVRLGFTLIELLVVIAIIALLVSILVPSLGEAKWMTKMTMCSSQLHSIGMGIGGYSSSWELDRPWLFYDGTEDGCRADDSWSFYPQPGNPALAMSNPDEHEEFIDDPHVYFCPVATDVNYEDNYDLRPSTLPGGDWVWGTYPYVFPRVTADEDPYIDTGNPGWPPSLHHTKIENINPVSANLVMYEREGEYPHANGLFLNGTVELITRTLDFDDSAQDEMLKFMYGPTGRAF